MKVIDRSGRYYGVVSDRTGIPRLRTVSADFDRRRGTLVDVECNRMGCDSFRGPRVDRPPARDALRGVAQDRTRSLCPRRRRPLRRASPASPARSGASVRRRRALAGVRVDVDLERVAEMRDNPGFYRGAADKVVKAACRLSERGEAWGSVHGVRKVFLSDLARETHTPMARLARLLVPWSNLGWVSLARADLVGKMDPRKVADSEIEIGDSRVNFIEIEPRKDCR